MAKDVTSLREDLYSVINHYAELSQLAKKGEVDPMGQIAYILRNRFPYLLVVIRDLLPHLERGGMTYDEVLFNLIREAQKFPDQKALAQSREEIEKIESNSRCFIYAVKWMDAEKNRRPSVEEVAEIRKFLKELNSKFKERYEAGSASRLTLIPHLLPGGEPESERGLVAMTADLAKRAILELFRLMVDKEPEKSSFFFANPVRKEMEEEIIHLARFVFRCGYTVDSLCYGYYKDQLSELLNERLLDQLIETEPSIKVIQGLSTHLAIMSLIDFGRFFELPGDYRNLEDPKEIARHVKVMKTKKRRGANLLKKVSDLHELYRQRPQGTLARKFLAYRYQAAFGDWHGMYRGSDTRGDRALELYKTALDRNAMQKQASADLQESGRFFSSKTRDEMAAIINLLMDSLENPTKVKGQVVKVLGDISSGAMGKVSIGILRGRIVAIKSVKSQVSENFGDPLALLTYEAHMHARVQTLEEYPYVVGYFGLIEQDDEKLLINSYHPNDNLTQLVERNWESKYKPPLQVKSKLTLSNFEVITNQLLDCLRRFKERGIVHRDLKTDNVLYMVDADEMVNRIKVIDFGVALAAGPPPVRDIFSGKVVGTFSYMAPEQVRGEATYESDLYSVGAILTVLLTGQLPLIFPKAQNRQELVEQIHKVQTEPRPRLVDLNPVLARNEVLKHMSRIVETMLELDPAKRPSIDEVQQALDDVYNYLGNEKYTLSIFYERTKR